MLSLCLLVQDDYNAIAQPANNSKELDVRALYFMEGGMAHGRLPIADAVVEREKIVEAAKSNRLRSANPAYQTALEEIVQLKEMNEELMETNGELKDTNKQLNETNQILKEENSVNREMMLVRFAPLFVPM